MILTRRQFKEYFKSLDPRLAVRGSPLWIPESFDDKKIRCRWFVCVHPVELGDKGEYWDWCRSALDGELRCFSCNNEKQEEWWGFTHRRDIVWWMLRWAR